MSEIKSSYILIAVLMVFGISSIVFHVRLYRELYNSLQRRGVVGSDFAPDWISKLSAAGCLGYVVRVKKEIGIAKLNAYELLQVKKTVISYYVGTLSSFFAICLYYLQIYSATN